MLRNPLLWMLQVLFNQCVAVTQELSCDVVAVVDLQLMGGELKRILEGQRQLEEQFNQLTLDEECSGVQQLRDHAHSINATTQGILCY